MSRPFRNLSKKRGLTPGAFVHIGDEKIENARIRIIDYDEEHLEEIELESLDEWLPYLDKPTVTWMNIDGVHDADLLEKLGASAGVHPLVMEDVMNTEQRPKMEDYCDYIFLVLKMFYNDDRNGILTEQMSFILGPNFVISFQERVGGVFDSVRERIRNGKGRMRRMGPDYLCYALIDSIVDNYFEILEQLGERIELLEEDLMENATSQLLNAIHKLKREMTYLRRSVWPLREVIACLERGESELIKESTQVFLRDLHDHTIQIIDTIETYREVLSGMLDTYLSGISNKMNQVMKLLTIIATIFIPLTFIAGIYGMNFKNMPELEWHTGYPLVLVFMVVIAIFMIGYFRKKKWL